MIYGPNKYLDGQTNFKMSDGNNINNGTTWKTEPVNRKKYENRKNCTHTQNTRVVTHFVTQNTRVHLRLGKLQTTIRFHE